MSTYWWNPWYQPNHRDASWPTWTSTSTSTFRMTQTCPTWRSALKFAEGLRNVITDKPKIRRQGASWVVSYTPRIWNF